MEIVGTDLIVCPQGAFGFHQHHDQHEFHYLLEARGKFHNGGVVSPLESTSLVYTPPRRDHGFVPHRPAPQPIYFIRFRPQNPTDHMLLADVEKNFGTRPRAIPALAATFEAIRQHAFKKGPHAALAAESGLAMILHAAAGGHLGQAGGTQHPAVESGLAYLEGSLERPVTFQEVVARSGLSPEGFARLFRRQTGETVLGYLRRRRVEHARFHLETTEDPVHHIALRLQFCDEFHFSKTFKKMTGFSPKSWRERSRALVEADDRNLPG